MPRFIELAAKPKKNIGKSDRVYSISINPEHVSDVYPLHDIRCKDGEPKREPEEDTKHPQTCVRMSHGGKFYVMEDKETVMTVLRGPQRRVLSAVSDEHDG